MAIPPQETAFVLTGYCTDKCTQMVSGQGPTHNPLLVMTRGEQQEEIWTPDPESRLSESLHTCLQQKLVHAHAPTLLK